MSPKIGPCMQRAPNVAACFTPVHGATGCGACHRSAPTGGAAYGTPRNARTPSAFFVPSTAPASVLTCAEAGSVVIMALPIRKNAICLTHEIMQLLPGYANVAQTFRSATSESAVCPNLSAQQWQV